jgi:hypothetical protein
VCLAVLLFIKQIIYEYGQPWWNDIDKGKSKNCPSANSSTTNPARNDPGAKTGLRIKRLATNRLSYGTA